MGHYAIGGLCARYSSQRGEETVEVIFRRPGEERLISVVPTEDVAVAAHRI